jgi:hypothetical protein
LGPSVSGLIRRAAAGNSRGRVGGSIESIKEVDVRILNTLFSFILATSAVASFAAEDVKRVSYKEMMQLNRANVAKIATGMTKD